MFVRRKQVDETQRAAAHRRIRERALNDPGLHQAAPPSEVQNVVKLLKHASADRSRPARAQPMIRPGADAGLAQPAGPIAREQRLAQAVVDARDEVQAIVMERIELDKIDSLPRDELARQVGALVSEILVDLKKRLNAAELRQLVDMLIDEMVGFGPLEPLLADARVSDILVNGAAKVFVERDGKLMLSDIKFRDDAHVLHIAQRIVSKVNRRIDETSPLVDARLGDGSRVNIIIPPLAIDGPSICIRKFAKHAMTLEHLVERGSLTAAMSTVLQAAARCRLNVLISGGTGAGKTTLMNAMSWSIDPGERVVTIEDAAELRLQQRHVVRLETRPANLEGGGVITMRDLLINALRMRPDRIILGEVRGEEALDMLQAMNTGHDGSLSTIHANRPRDALIRLENMVAMAGVELPNRTVRTQISSAIDLVVQIARLRDGKRRVTKITEILGMEGDTIVTQDLFGFEPTGEDVDGSVIGVFKFSGLPPHFMERAKYYGLEDILQCAVQPPASDDVVC